MSQFLIILPCQIWCCPTSWQSLLVSQLQKLIRILRGQFLYVPCWLDQAGVEEWNGLNLLSVAGGDMVLEVHGDSCPTPCILNSVALFLVNAYSEMSDSFNFFIYIYMWVPMFWQDSWNHTPQNAHATPLSFQSTDLSQTPHQA